MSSQGSEGSQESTQDYVNDTVLYILSQDHNKYPIKRQDIVKYALKNNGKNFKHAMEEATNILKQVFGMNLIEVEHGSTKHHILVNGIKNPGGLMEFKWSNEEEAHQILLMIVLSFIFMTGGVAKEESVWTFLTKLGILWTNKPHELFGDVRKLLTQILQSMTFDGDRELKKKYLGVQYLNLSV
ncbi:non-structural maintenance of chromosomes element 3 homolog isoform X2 [Periplaneta americana]|uniref:non-structural maintenance of chromosomes element 3 homolog isoform X2 n=1 Tax=Periplaneta americana TaxID=6978 RepID=UPI0037E978CC